MDGNGQDARGRFTPGNKLGKGNPLAGRAAKIRATLLAKMSDEEVGQIVDVLLDMAKAGNLLAIREALDRSIGRPVAADVLERIERLEALLEGKDSWVSKIG